MAKFDLAITAHDSKKEEVGRLIEKYRQGMTKLSIVATMNTSLAIKQITGLDTYRLGNGAIGGYLQMAKLVAEHDVKMVVFLQDPLSINLDELGIRLLLQACSINNVPLASNFITAEFILHRYLEKEMAVMWRCPERLHVSELLQVGN